MAEIRFDAVGKTFPDGTRAVDGVSLTIPDGQLVVLVGPSGCGKTTLLRMVAGLEHVTDGVISIDGHPVNAVPPKNRDIAMVFQSYALYPHMSVYDNMAFSLKLRHVPKGEIERRVRAAAETLGLSELLKRKPRQLSGGQRQRVAMGGRSFASHGHSSWTSPSRTSTPSCGCRCAARSDGSSESSA